MTSGKNLYATMKQGFDFTPVLDAAMRETRMTRDEAESHFDGLLQWFSVIPFARPGQPVQMVGSIDRLWHAFVLNTKLYRAFCDRYFGRYIDHDPMDRFDEAMSKRQYARFTLATLRSEFGDDVHPAFVDLAQRVTCCYGQCDDGGGDGGGLRSAVTEPATV
jgi:hypothetical protein